MTFTSNASHKEFEVEVRAPEVWAPYKARYLDRKMLTTLVVARTSPIFEEPVTIPRCLMNSEYEVSYTLMQRGSFLLKQLGMVDRYRQSVAYDNFMSTRSFNAIKSRVNQDIYDELVAVGEEVYSLGLGVESVAAVATVNFISQVKQVKQNDGWISRKLYLDHLRVPDGKERKRAASDAGKYITYNKDDMTLVKASKELKKVSKLFTRMDTLLNMGK